MIEGTKLHLGCGPKYIPGFIHIDAIEYEHIDHCTNIDNLEFFDDSSVDLIYNCHVLEHFRRDQLKKVLEEWHRVLKPGGTLRCAVPDFQALSEIYAETHDLSLIIGPIVGRQNYLYNFHYNIFDFKSLTDALKKVGFRDIKRYDWRDTEHADIDDYSQAYIPHMDKENGKLVSLNIEARK